MIRLKECTTCEIKEYYDNKDFNSDDTTKTDELFDYADVPSYLRTSKKSYDNRDKDDFKMIL